MIFNKKKALLSICIILLLLTYCYNSVNFDLSATLVSRIYIMNRTTGQEINVVNPDQIEHIITNINSLSYKIRFRKPGFGSRYWVKIYNEKNNLLLEYKILSDQEAYLGVIRFQVHNGCFDIQYINSLFS